RLRGSFGEVSLGRAALAHPDGAELLLDLPAVGQPVLCVPGCAPLPLMETDVPAHGPDTLRLHGSSTSYAMPPAATTVRGRFPWTPCNATRRSRTTLSRTLSPNLPIQPDLTERVWFNQAVSQAA